MNLSSQFQVLSDDQCQEVYLSVLKVLEQTGVVVRCEEALGVLRDNGARVVRDRAYVPAALIEKARSTAPSTFTLYSRERDPSKNMVVAPNRTGFGPAPATPHVLDPHSGARRPSMRSDVIAAAKVCDALPHVDWVTSLAEIGGVRPELAPIYEFADLIANTGKPLWGWAYTLDACRDIHQIAAAVAGGDEELASRPIYFFFCEAMSPLGCDRHAAEHVMYCARHRIPLVFAPVEMSGGTAPATLAATVLMSVADSMLGLVLSQMLSPGLPFVMGGTCTVLDMQTGLIPYGAPELSLLCAAAADVARYLGVPHFSTSGLSDTFVDDNQAALDGTISNLFCMLCGSEMTHNVGSLEASKTGSLRYLVLMDSVIGYAKRVLLGYPILPSVMEPSRHGRGSWESTLDGFDIEGMRESDLLHSLFGHRETSAAGHMSGHRWSMLDRAQLKLDWILENHRPSPLPPEVQGEINDIISAAEKRYALTAPDVEHPSESSMGSEKDVGSL